MFQIKCREHPDQDIILIDLNRNSKLHRRGLCSFCTENEKFQNLCPIEQLPGKIEELQSQKQQEIEIICNTEQSKLQQTLKMLVTLKDKINQTIESCIYETEQLMLSFHQKVKTQQQLYTNLLHNLTRTKLEEIADLLSGKTSYVSIIFQVQEIFQEISLKYATLLKQSIDYQREVFDSIGRNLLDRWQEKNQVILQGKCQVLASNEQKQLIIGGIGKQIYVWEESDQKLIQRDVLWGHSDNVSALAFFKTGEMFVSSGDYKAKTIKLWKYTQNRWKCAQKLKDHKGGIIAMQLTPNEELLITAGRDNMIVIWKILSKEQTLKKVQDLLRNHETPVFSIAVSPDSSLLSSSSNSIQVYHRLGQDRFDKDMGNILNIQFQEPIQLGRLYFAENTELIAQRIDKPMLIIIKLVSVTEYYISQTLKLNELCNDLYRCQAFSVGNFIYFYNNSIYIIQKAVEGSYYIHQRIFGDFTSGCADANGVYSLLSCQEDLSIKFFGRFVQQIKDC